MRAVTAIKLPDGVAAASWKLRSVQIAGVDMSGSPRRKFGDARRRGGPNIRRTPKETMGGKGRTDEGEGRGGGGRFGRAMYQPSPTTTWLRAAQVFREETRKPAAMLPVDKPA